jgi:hypothetical protein
MEIDNLIAVRVGQAVLQRGSSYQYSTPRDRSFLNMMSTDCWIVISWLLMLISACSGASCGSSTLANQCVMLKQLIPLSRRFNTGAYR